MKKTSFIVEREIPKPSQFMEYLKQNKVKFKEFTSIEGEHDGSSPKSFLLLDDSLSKRDIPSTVRTMQDSRYMAHLFDEVLNNPDTSLVTYLNDAIRNGVFPRYVSCLAKNCIFDKTKRDTIDDGRNASEVIGSRIAEVLRVPTVYTIGIPAIDGSIGSVVSVDFLKYGEQFEDILELSGNKISAEMGDTVEQWKKTFRKALRKKYPLGIDRECLRQLEERDLPQTLLFRNGGAFKDADLYSYNIGIVSSGRKFKLAPNFDMECLLTSMKCSPEYYSVDKGAMRDVVSYCAEHCPDILEDFVHRLNTNMGNGTIPSIIEGLYPNKKVTRNILDNLRTTVVSLNLEANKYLSKSMGR